MKDLLIDKECYMQIDNLARRLFETFKIQFIKLSPEYQNNIVAVRSIQLFFANFLFNSGLSFEQMEMIAKEFSIQILDILHTAKVADRKQQ